MKSSCLKETTLKNEGVVINNISFCISSNLVTNDEEIKDEINDKINKYFCKFKWENSKGKLHSLFKNQVFTYRNDLGNYLKINPEYIEKFYSYFDNIESSIFNYIEIKPYLKQQTRKRIYHVNDSDKDDNDDDKDNDEDYEYLNNLLYIFNAEKYRETEKTSEIDYNYLTAVLKILLFFKLTDCLKVHIGTSELKEDEVLTLEYLANNAVYKVDNALITGIELYDILTPAKYMYEDYFYELTQLNLNNANSLCISNLKNQNLVYRFENPEKYSNRPKKKFNPDKWRKQNRKIKKFLESINDDIEGDYYEDYEIPIEDGFYEFNNLLKHGYNPKRNTNILVKFRRDINNPDKNIKLTFTVYEIESIKYILKLPDTKISSVFLALDKDLELNFYSYILERIFHDSKEFENNFEAVKRSTFSCDLNFCKDKIIGKQTGKRQNHIADKTILTILLNNHNNDELTDVFKKLNPKQRKELKELIIALKKKRKGIKYKAILDMYKYFQMKVGTND